MKLLSCLRTALCLLGVLAMPAAAAYPEKPINMIIAFTAGGSSDVQARIMQKYLSMRRSRGCSCTSPVREASSGSRK